MFSTVLESVAELNHQCRWVFGCVVLIQAKIPTDVPDTVMAVYSSQASQGPVSKQAGVPKSVTSSLFSCLEV